MLKFIAKAEATSGTVSSLQFTSIPTTYDDLYIVWNPRSAGSSGFYVSGEMTYNGGGTYYQGRLYSESSGTAGDASAATFFGIMPNNGETVNIFSSTTIYIPGYKDTSKTKKNAWANSGLTGVSSSGFNIFAMLVVESGPTAISSITLKAYDSTNLAQYSSAYLYGISNS